VRYFAKPQDRDFPPASAKLKYWSMGVFYKALEGTRFDAITATNKIIPDFPSP